MDPSGQFAYALALNGNAVSGYTIDPITGALTTIVGSPFPSKAEGQRALSVSVINPSANTVVATVMVGPNPVNAALTPDGTAAYIANAPRRSLHRA